MDVREEKVLLSADRFGRVAIVRRVDGLFCLYAHWRWSPETKASFAAGPVEDRRWTSDYDARLYDDADPLPGIYGNMDDAEAEARRLLGLQDGERHTKLITLDGSRWLTPEDFYSALLPRLGAPAWHGRNLNALDDSLYGGINAVEPPFSVVVTGTESLSANMIPFFADVATVFSEARRQYGADVTFETI